MRAILWVTTDLGADKSWGRAPEAASNVHNSHEKRREKAKMRGILSVNTTVPQLPIGTCVREPLSPAKFSGLEKKIKIGEKDKNRVLVVAPRCLNALR